MKTQGKILAAAQSAASLRWTKCVWGKCQSVVSLQQLQLYDDMTVFMKHPVVIPTKYVRE